MSDPNFVEKKLDNDLYDRYNVMFFPGRREIFEYNNIPDFSDFDDVSEDEEIPDEVFMRVEPPETKTSAEPNFAQNNDAPKNRMEGPSTSGTTSFQPPPMNQCGGPSTSGTSSFQPPPMNQCGGPSTSGTSSFQPPPMNQCGEPSTSFYPPPLNQCGGPSTSAGTSFHPPQRAKIPVFRPRFFNDDNSKCAQTNERPLPGRRSDAARDDAPNPQNSCSNFENIKFIKMFGPSFNSYIDQDQLEARRRYRLYEFEQDPNQPSTSAATDTPKYLRPFEEGMKKLNDELDRRHFNYSSSTDQINPNAAYSGSNQENQPMNMPPQFQNQPHFFNRPGPSG